MSKFSLQAICADKRTIILQQIMMILLILLTWWLYARSIPSYPVLDDTVNLGILELLPHNNFKGWWDLAWNNDSGYLPRAVSMLTLILDTYLSPGSYVRMRSTNIIIHLLIGILVYFWIKILVDNYLHKSKFRYLPFFVAGAWLLAPLNVSTVYYPVQRMAQLPVFFTVAGLLHYTLLRTVGTNWKSIKKWLNWIVIYLLWCPLALLSKDNGALLPLLIALTEIGLFRENHDRPFSKIMILFAWLSIFVYVTGALYVILQGDMLNYGNIRDFNAMDRIATQPTVLLDYLKQLLVPDLSRMGVIHDDFPIRYFKGTRSLIPAFVALIFFCIALLALSVKNKSIRLIAYGIVLFFVGHSLESTVFGLEIYFEHRNYLPSIGFFIALSGGLYLFFDVVKIKGPPTAIMSVFLLMSAMNVHSETNTWNDQIFYISKIRQHHPGSFRINLWMAELYNAMNKPERSLEIMQEFLSESQYENSAKLVPFHVLYYSLHAGIELPADFYSSLMPPWHPRTFIANNRVIETMAMRMGDDMLNKLNWVEFSKVLDGVLANSELYGGDRVANTFIRAGHLAIRFEDKQRALAYFTIAANYSRKYAPWTHTPLFHLYLENNMPSKALTFLEEFENDARWATIYQVHLSNLRQTYNEYIQSSVGQRYMPNYN